MPIKTPIASPTVAYPAPASLPPYTSSGHVTATKAKSHALPPIYSNGHREPKRDHAPLDDVREILFDSQETTVSSTSINVSPMHTKPRVLPPVDSSGHRESKRDSPRPDDVSEILLDSRETTVSGISRKASPKHSWPSTGDGLKPGLKTVTRVVSRRQHVS